jgi:hypothetical protein
MPSACLTWGLRLWHTFWNAGDDDASALEIISPSGFEKHSSG